MSDFWKVGRGKDDNSCYMNSCSDSSVKYGPHNITPRCISTGNIVSGQGFYDRKVFKCEEMVNQKFSMQENKSNMKINIGRHLTVN